MAIKNLGSGLAMMREFVNNTVPNRIEAKTHEIAEFALSTAMYYSPFQTGRFMASWRITKSPDAFGEGAAPGSRTTISAQAEAKAASAPVIRSLKLGQTWYLGNGVSYAKYVEYGGKFTEPHYITQRVAQSVGGFYGRIYI